MNTWNKSGVQPLLEKAGPIPLKPYHERDYIQLKPRMGDEHDTNR